MRIQYVCCAAVLLALAGCVSSMRPSSQTEAIVDGVPDRDIDVTHLADATVQRVVVTNAGNKSPYTVLGKSYHVNFDTAGFVESGYASWYGKKFHGRKTSNGETYDMYQMTAAHKTLAIPTYVRVTNLENQRTVVVRVNDRGPFHEGRIIDLSYAAAKKLDYHHRGTAKVKIEVLAYEGDSAVAEAAVSAPITADRASQISADVGTERKKYLQVGAFSRQKSALELQRRLHDLTGTTVEVREESSSKLYKVLVGPIADSVELLALRQKLLEAELAEPHVVEL